MTRILAWIYIFIGMAGILGGLFLCIGFWIEGPGARDAFAWTLVLFLVAALLVLVPALAGGIGLLLGRQWGRILSVIVSGLLLTLFPVGTAVGAFGLWVLLGTRQARDEWSSRESGTNPTGP